MAVFLNITWMRSTLPGERSWNVVRLRDEQPPLVLGRSHEVAIRLEANTVSRRHAELRVHDGKVSIRDIGAINGIRRFPGDQRCQPFIWMDVPPLNPLFVTEYQLVVLDRPPMTHDEYRDETNPEQLLRMIPGPNVRLRLEAMENLLTQPALQSLWCPGRDAASLLVESGVNDRVRPPMGDPVPLHHRVRALFDFAESRHLLTREQTLGIVRDFLGDFLFDATIPPAVHAWRDGLVRTMAIEIDRERRYGDLPILADALEDAGYDRVDLLEHLRQSEPHYPGCWAIELLTALPGGVLPIQ